jgi:integrase
VPPSHAADSGRTGKGAQGSAVTLAPEFAQFLAETPAERRHGYVFSPRPIRADKAGCRLGEQQVERVIGCIGKAAGVKVSEKARGDKQVFKFASAHDLRRSFGERWASRVMPQVLMELMRHESIDTTLRYYVGRNAQQTAGVLWEAAKHAAGATLGATPSLEAAADSSQVVGR